MTRLREYTCRILDHVEEGIFDKDILIRDLLNWMSEHDVKEFYEFHVENESDED
jgi:hypothetical protein